jgi:AmmeMemoRadiSam system protein B
LAEHQHMVPRTSRQQIVVGLILIGSLIVLGLMFGSRTVSKSPNPIYSASADDLDLAVLNGIVEAGKDYRQVSATKAVVVPHHLVASKSIALGVKAIASSTPKIVIVISPDHYARCPKLLCTTKGSYKTFFGDVSIEESAVNDLEKSDLVSSSELFKEEHGVYTIAPYIKHYLPEAKIVPIAISQKTRGSEESRTEVIKLLQPLLSRKDVALVISSDFSHYLPLTETKQKDIQTQSSFCSGNSDEILNLENPSQSDCPLCLWILEQEAEQLGFWNPVLLAHTNSAELMRDPSARELTSHFAFALSSQAVPAGSCPIPRNTSMSEAKILFVGDMNFDRYIRQVANKHGVDYLFSCIDPLLKDADFVVGNLEGPITSHESISEGTVIGSPENYRFTFPTTTAQLLFQYNIKVVNIGNNHINDFGSEGISSTRKYLTDIGVSYFGGLAGNTSLYRLSDNGIDLSFINYNQFGGDSPEKTAELIASEHAAGRKVFVYTHWGEEYTTPTEQVRSIAKMFSENGADMIIGSHPHVIQEHEFIGDTPIYYSLGNFIFDQYFGPGVTKGLGILVHISKNKISIDEKPVSLNSDGRTCPI